MQELLILKSQLAIKLQILYQCTKQQKFICIEDQSPYCYGPKSFHVTSIAYLATVTRYLSLVVKSIEHMHPFDAPGLFYHGFFFIRYDISLTVQHFFPGSIFQYRMYVNVSITACISFFGACNLRCPPGAITIQIQNSLLSD